MRRFLLLMKDLVVGQCVQRLSIAGQAVLYKPVGFGASHFQKCLLLLVQRSLKFSIAGVAFLHAFHNGTEPICRFE